MTKDDVLRALRKYFLPLFDPSTAVAVVVTAPSKAEEIGKALETRGFAVEQRALEVESDEDSDQSESGSQSDSESHSSVSDASPR